MAANNKADPVDAWLDGQAKRAKTDRAPAAIGLAPMPGSRPCALFATPRMT
jgi:hypothetical protein